MFLEKLLFPMMMAIFPNWATRPLKTIFASYVHHVTWRNQKHSLHQLVRFPEAGGVQHVT